MIKVHLFHGDSISQSLSRLMKTLIVKKSEAHNTNTHIHIILLVILQVSSALKVLLKP